MKKYKIGIEEVYDLFAVRFVLKCAREDEKRLCWQTYSIVTDFNTPNPDRLRDWISIPKLRLRCRRFQQFGDHVY